LQLIDDIYSDVEDVESGARDFTVTGEMRLLEANEAGGRDVDAKLKRLRALTSDNPSQVERVDSFESQIHAKLAFNTNVIATRKLVSGATRIDLAEGTRLMDAIRKTYQALRGEEERLMQGAIVRAADAISVAWVTKLSLASIVTGSLILAAFFIGRKRLS
jgi:CHASE3 domain sensor protein